MYSIVNACITVFNITLIIKMQYRKEFTETPKGCFVSPKTLLKHRSSDKCCRNSFQGVMGHPQGEPDNNCS